MQVASMAYKLGLAPGYRFVPTDDEVVAYYLLRRIRCQPLPAGDIFEDDVLSAPPWTLLQRHGRKRDAFFFAEGQAMNGKGSRKKRSCAGGGTWEGQGKRKTAKGGEGEKLRLVVGGEEIEWQKYALNFHEEDVKGSTGWVMHEYSITSPAYLAESPLRVYRIRFSGHGKNAKKRKMDDLDWGSDEEEEEDGFPARAGAATLPAAVAEFAGECPAGTTQPESVSSFPLVLDVDVSDVQIAGWTGAGAGSDQDLPALVDGGDNWNFTCSMNDLVPDFDVLSGEADGGDFLLATLTDP